MSSAEQYFRAGVLKEKSDISQGLGLPDPTLAGCLAVCWLLLYLTLRKKYENCFWIFSSGSSDQFKILRPDNDECVALSFVQFVNGDQRIQETEK